MKIEFRKVPLTPNEFTTEHSSVKIEGIFCKMSPSLVKVDAKITGKIPVTCARCGEESLIELDEEMNFLLSDGIYRSNSESDELVIEVENSLIDFDEILESEISSMQSDYYICENCKDSDFVEKEY